MPMSGGTRMLRARRKDCNVKPNRRLDRKSSRGMLFENEELRMRTITINAEVEQGQHALKKLRRENEQLRREMWCLRDEYDKMEKLLRKKETDEDSDQENSDSDDNYSRTDDSDEEKAAMKRVEGAQQEENPDLENEENLQKSSKFGNGANVRTFDGLSVIDEQTEETQTTESAAGYGTLSRGNSVNRTFNQPVPMYDEACGAADYPPFGYPPDSYGGKPQPRKKGLCSYENDWTPGQVDTYDVRPASPYPYNGSLRPSYQKRIQALQEMPLVPQSAGNGIGENGWIFPDPSKVAEVPNYEVYGTEPAGYVAEKATSPEMCPVVPPMDFNYDLIEDRAGPDVFVTGGYPQARAEGVRAEAAPKDEVGEEEDRIIENVEAEIDKIEISEKSENDPNIQKMTTLTKSAVSRSGAGLTTIADGSQETLDPGKLTMDEAVEKNDNGISNHVQHLVSCQNPNGQQHVRETGENAPEAGQRSPPSDEMPQVDRSGGSKYQTKLMVTLKSPGPPGGRGPKKVPGPVPPKTFQPQLRYGIRPEYAMAQRFQTFPSPAFQPNVRMPAANGRDFSLVNHYAGVRMPGGSLSGSLPRLPHMVPKNELCLNPANIPDDFDKELDVLPDEESLAIPVAQPLVKPVKIPPAPPPRTSSCPKPTIPASPVGVTALHHRTFRKGKAPYMQNTLEEESEHFGYNPLLLSQPIATSSPTISLKGVKYGMNGSSENLYGPKYRKQSYNDESSLEDFSRQKSRLKDELNRVDVPRLNKSVSSPSFGSFRTFRRKPSEALASSVEILTQKIPEVLNSSEKPDKKSSKGHSAQNNISISSSSGLDSPTKSDRRKRRVSIQFKKKQSSGEGKHLEDGRDSLDSRRNSIAPGILSVKGTKVRGKMEETDATTSDRERTNSASSRTSSVMAGSSRRKFSISSNRTYLNDEKIPWCGCWGNGCV